jgi:hypothetical protein
MSDICLSRYFWGYPLQTLIEHGQIWHELEFPIGLEATRWPPVRDYDDVRHRYALHNTATDSILTPVGYTDHDDSHDDDSHDVLIEPISAFGCGADGCGADVFSLNQEEDGYGSHASPKRMRLMFSPMRRAAVNRALRRRYYGRTNLRGIRTFVKKVRRSPDFGLYEKMSTYPNGALLIEAAVDYVMLLEAGFEGLSANGDWVK